MRESLFWKYHITCVIFCICIATGLATETAAQGLSAMDKEAAVSEIIDAVPKSGLCVKYGNVSVEMGNVLTPTQAQNPPTVVTWNADPEKFYTLFMIDADVPSSQNPKFKEWQHWLVGNIKGSDIGSGEVLSQYIGAGPPPGKGLQRYIFVLFEQPQQLTFDEKRLTNNSVNGRGRFSTRSFAKKYNLGDPIAGNYFQAEYDDYVPKLYEQLGFK